MKKLKDILNESQHLSYKRMNVGEEKEEKGMTNEEKREFLKAVSEYKKFGESIYRSGNLAEVYESVKGIVETAHKVTLEETGDWFDKVTVNRHMKSMNESFKVFEKTIHEVNTLQQRLESCYDEMGEVLGKYYEIKEGNEFGAARAKAIAKGDDEFEVDGKKFPVKDVDKDDKENAKKFAKESVNESKYTVINPKNGNVMGAGLKDQAAKLSKKMGGEKKGYYVIPVSNAKKARRALEKYNFDLKNQKLHSMLGDLYFENTDESVNEAYVKSMGYKAVDDRITSLTKSLDPNGVLCKNISKNADNVKPEFKQMKKYIDAIDQLWGEVDYVIAMSNESVNEGKHDAILDKLADIVKGAKSFMDIGKELKKNGIKYSFGTNMIPMYIIDKPVKIAILNNKYADGAERVVGTTAIGLMESIQESINEESSMKLKDLLNKNLTEGYSTEEKRIVMMAVRKISKYMNVDIKTAMMYVLGAGEELQRDIEKGKVKK